MVQPGSVDLSNPSASGERRAGSSRLLSSRYRLVRPLGAGSMGEVYEAEHVYLGKRVALKMLRSELCASPSTCERFQREARALAALSSEFVVTVFDCGNAEHGAPYLVMELLHGEDLRQVLRREGSLSVRRALRIVKDACRGAIALHDAGVVHRDLKPANLFVTQRTTGEELCKILDLGVAKRVGGDVSHHGTLIGTVRYMAPEQLSDGSAAGPLADVYALGTILYECVTGLPLHDAASEEELMFRILNGTAVPHLGGAGFPPALARIVQRATARDPQQRFASAGELLRALEELLPEARLDDTLSDASHPGVVAAGARRPRAWFPGLVGLLLVAIFAAAGVFAKAAPGQGQSVVRERAPEQKSRIAPSGTSKPVTPLRVAPPPEPSSAPASTSSVRRRDTRKVVPEVSKAPPAEQAHELPRPDFDVENPYSESKQ